MTYLSGEQHGPVGLSKGTPRPQVRAEVPAALLDPDGQLIDWLVGFTLGTLDGQHVEIRVLPDLCDHLVVSTAYHSYQPSSRGHSEVP